jgi:hypothetical protein
MEKLLFEVKLRKKGYDMKDEIFIVYTESYEKAIRMALKAQKSNSFRGEKYTPVIESIKMVHDSICILTGDSYGLL